MPDREDVFRSLLDRACSAAALGEWEGATAAAAEAYQAMPHEDVEWDLHAEAIAEAMACAVEAGRLDAAAVLSLDAEPLSGQRRAIDALQAGDAELALALLKAGGSGACDTSRLDRSLGALTAAALARGDLMQRCLSVEALGIGQSMTIVSEEDVAKSRLRELEWVKGLGLPRASAHPVARWIALVRLGMRRVEGADAAIFKRLAADTAWWIADWAPALFEEVSRMASRLVEEGSVDEAHLAVWWLDSLLRGHEAEVRQHLEMLRQTRKYGAKKRDRVLERCLERAPLIASRRAERAADKLALLTTEEGLARRDLGDFYVSSGALVLSDPCYDIAATYAGSEDSGVTASVPHAKPGLWRAATLSIEIDDKPVNAFLVAHHKDHPCSLADESWRELTRSLGVDAGVVGIFEACHFHDQGVVPDQALPDAGDKGRWFALCCVSADGDNQGGVVPFGCVSVSGRGDGLYDAHTVETDEGATAVCINFGTLPYEEDEDEEGGNEEGEADE